MVELDNMSATCSSTVLQKVDSGIGGVENEENMARKVASERCCRLVFWREHVLHLAGK